MNKFSVSLLWLCLILFVLCTTLLIAAAAIPRFAIYNSKITSVPPTNTTQLDDSEVRQSVYIGAFRAVYVDGDTTYTAAISSSCTIDWEGYEDTVFDERTNAAALCSQFNAFRALLLVSIVLDGIVAVAICTALFRGWLPPNSKSSSLIAVIAITLPAVTAIACNVAAFILMIEFVVWEFDMETVYGISFKLAVAAAIICLIATAIFVADCIVSYYHAIRIAKQEQHSITKSVIIDLPKSMIEERFIMTDTTVVTVNNIV